MKYNYKIIYDIKKDMWNWRGAVGDSFMGSANIDNIDNESDRNIANQMLGLKKRSAEMILKPYLLSKKIDANSRLNKFMVIAEKDFRNKFTDACLALERITKRPMMSDKFTFYVTTFPRMTVFFDTCVIFMYASIEGVWGMPIDGFLHEALHFQFNHYWRQDPTSPVYKLTEDEFTYIKEALVVVLDYDIKPIITLPDKGYAAQADYCKIMHNHWRAHHDFDKLVEFGLSKLPEFIT